METSILAICERGLTSVIVRRYFDIPMGIWQVLRRETWQSQFENRALRFFLAHPVADYTHAYVALSREKVVGTDLHHRLQQGIYCFLAAVVENFLANSVIWYLGPTPGTTFDHLSWRGAVRYKRVMAAYLIEKLVRNISEREKIGLLTRIAEDPETRYSYTDDPL